MTDADRLNFEVFYNSESCAYLVVTAKGKLLRSNRTLSYLTGFSEEEIFGMPYWTDLLSIGGKIYYETHLRPLLRMQGQVNEIQLELKTAGGGRLPVLLGAILQAGEKEDLIYLSIFPIRQRKQYEAELLAAKKNAEKLVETLLRKNTELDKFALRVSHDLKGPLSNMTAVSDLLQELYGNNEDEEFARFVSYLGESANNLKSLIDRLLDYYKNSENSEMPAEDIDLVRLLNAVCNLLNAEEKHEIILPKNTVLIRANRVVLEQIFINLINNAIKYNDKEKVIIQIGFEEDVQFYRFSVTDNGTGIPEKDRAKIFELFTTNNTKDRYGKTGTGIGLSSVKKLTEQQGGEIRLDSEVGKGSVFYFSIAKSIPS